jgi:hypothetical protein
MFFGARRWVAVGVCALLLCACGDRKADHKTNSRNDELARASFLVDQQQYSEAIFILTERIKGEPNDVKARVLLASAYAARAGLHFSRYKDLASDLSRWDKDAEAGGLADSGDPLIRRLATHAWQIHLVLRAFDSIPTVNTSRGVEDVQKGLAALAEADKLGGGPAVYRALLRTVLLKNRLRTTSPLDGQKICRIDIKFLDNWLQTLGAELKLIMQDLASGTADVPLKEKLAKSSAQVDEWARQASVPNMMKQAGVPLENQPSIIEIPMSPTWQRILGPCE